ncbi:MAG: valine--tRNA ligase [Firmicutes bacterium]|nr:valine--tRNA ligase [Bacillota bacterium]
MRDESKTSTAREATRPTGSAPGSADGQALPPVYEPRQIEPRWYAYWERNGYFNGDPDPSRPGFGIVMPPPNVTGSLHVGHALDNTLADILVRFRRMQGYSTLWLPGTDHAGIATQVVVEQELAREGKSRHDLGREKFLERVWDWKERYGGIITQQLRRLGSSCDWSRERFTMDPGCSRAVREAFVHLYEKGLIYRGDYIINWCPRCRTALSDLEVEHEETEGRLWYLRYPLEDGSGDIMVATTRPETMLGDTGIAVHPQDTRYLPLIGKAAILPLVGRKLPIVADEAVDMGFGTGAVKVTPAHAPTDFEIGRRHGRETVKVIDERGRITEAAPPELVGLDRAEARQQVVEALRRGGYLVREEVHRHAVGHCQRCGTVVEPLVSKQWFVRMKPLAEPAIRAVRERRVRLLPERFESHFFHWMENVRDWCISRQLWWGHRIPVWYCSACGRETVSVEDPTACRHCGSPAIEQDPDVLDTWFSSALWPFSTLGWPERTADLSFYYPTSLLVTGFDILFFWVARMMVMGLELMGDVPVRDVLLHGLVRDALGRKMSKSRGTGVDPLEVIEEYGADALRLTLVMGVGMGNDLRWHPDRVEASRNFANKLWNAARFALMRMPAAGAVTSDGRATGSFSPERIRHWAAAGELALPERWILSRLARHTREVTELLERYEVGEAARALYDFAWDELCDWYIELAKPRLSGQADDAERQRTAAVLWYVLERTARLLHPFMPFVTEEIWQRLPHQGPTVMLAPWPQPDDALVDEAAEERMRQVMDVIRAIRNVRAEKGVSVSRRIPARVWAPEEVRATLAEHADDIRRLAGVSELGIEAPGPERPKDAVPAVAGPQMEIFVPLAGLVDADEELRRLGKELAEVEQLLSRWRGMLANPAFVDRAPRDVVESTRRKQEEAEQRRARLVEQMEQLRRLVR